MFGWHLSAANLFYPPHPGREEEREGGRRVEGGAWGEMGQPNKLGKFLRIRPWVPTAYGREPRLL